VDYEKRPTSRVWGPRRAKRREQKRKKRGGEKHAKKKETNRLKKKEAKGSVAPNTGDGPLRSSKKKKRRKGDMRSKGVD